MSQVSTNGAVPQLRVELRSNPLFLAGVRELISQVAKRLGFAEDAAGQMALAVDEALCNVIRHGYAKQADRPIWLSLWAEGGAWAKSAAGGASSTLAAGPEAMLPDALRIVIEDEARQVDPATIKSRDLEEIRPGGLGVHIIKSVMDEARYERREGEGMRLVMVKKRVGSVSGCSGACAHAAPAAEVSHG